MLLPMNPQFTTGEKHEEGDCQDYPGYVFVACLGHSAGPGRQCTVAWVLAKTVPSAIVLSIVSGWFKLATHSYAEI